MKRLEEEAEQARMGNNVVGGVGKEGLIGGARGDLIGRIKRRTRQRGVTRLINVRHVWKERKQRVGTSRRSSK